MPDQLLGYGRTGQNGWFSITWRASAGLVETDFDVYAVFNGDSTYDRARTPDQEMSVYKRSGSITLADLPASARIGEIVEFSGTLRLDGRNPEGAVVYIKDEDPFSGDDLLATAYVDRSGRFSTYWYASDVDPDNTVDIYAVFEGKCPLFQIGHLRIRTDRIARRIVP